MLCMLASTNLKYESSVTQSIVQFDLFSTFEYYKNAHILPAELRIRYKVCLLVHKALEDACPPYIRQLIRLYHEEPNKRGLRAFSDKRLLLRPPIRENKISRRLFEFQAPLLWNTLPAAMRHCRDTITFKRDLKTFLFDHINSEDF